MNWVLLVTKRLFPWLASKVEATTETNGLKWVQHFFREFCFGLM
jgi:hypothetical protein